MMMFFVWIFGDGLVFVFVLYCFLVYFGLWGGVVMVCDFYVMMWVMDLSGYGKSL